jgi:hypothetical protein
MSNQMTEAMQAEREQALAYLKEANDLLMKMFNVQTGDEE